MANYEVVFVVDPRLTDEEVAALSQEYKEMITSFEAEVTREESWGKKKLAYPINKLSEGRYLLLEVSTGAQNPFVEVERRMQQNEKVLRYLTVRTDEGRLRRRTTKAVAHKSPPAGRGRPAREGRPPREDR